MNNYDTKSYDIYDKGYKSGSQAFIFLGPIWIEEAAFFQIDRSNTKKPVYGYNEVKYDRLLQGRYLVQGTLGINYVEANYLTRTIKKVQEQSVMRGTLQDLIVNQKSLFLDRMQKSKAMQQMVSDLSVDVEGLQNIEKFVKRICNEAELASSTGNLLDPNTFEITFIFGDLYDTTQSIEIYEGVQISSSGIRTGNDDEVTIEIYNWTARGMKEAETKEEQDKYKYTLNKANLLAMAKEVSDQLVDKILEEVTIDVHANNQRTKLMNNTMKLGVAGMLHPNTRMFGRNASFIEMVYAMELPREYSTNTSGEAIKSKTSLLAQVRKEVVASKAEPKAWGTPPTIEESTIFLKVPNQPIASMDRDAFDNSFGKIASINRTHSAEKIKAISPVKIENLTYKLGGSIALPQYRKKDFNIGSFIPPVILPNTESSPYNFEEKDIEAITYSTLWCGLTGYRGIGNSYGEDKQESNPQRLNEISQPLYSFSYVKDVKASYIAGGDYSIDISVPTYIDFLNLDKASGEKLGGRTEEALVTIGEDDIFRITYNNSGAETFKGIPDTEDENDVVFNEAIVMAQYKLVENVQHMASDSVIPQLSGQLTFDNFKPYFFEFNMQNNSAKLASDFHKSLYIVPFIFEDKPYTLPHTGNNLTSAQALKNLAYLLSENNNQDSSCTYDMDYDWGTKDVSGVQTLNGKIKVNGVYFLNPKNTTSNGKNVHVIWLMSLIPIKRQKTGTNTNGISIVHDIDELGGRYAEFYNITRCDNMYHIRSVYDMYDPQSSIIDQMIAGLKDLWDVLRNTFNEDYEANYALPIKKNLDRICGFMDGYAVSINRQEIVSQIKKCEFTDQAIRTYMDDFEGKITFVDALTKAMGKEGSEETMDEELTSIINKSINDKIEIRGANIIEDRGSGSVISEINVPMPPTDVIAWGLLTDGSGAEELLDIRKKNMQYKQNSKQQATTETISTGLTLGGYSAII